MILALALAMSLGAWAQQEVLLTTINASSGFTNGTQTFDNIVTVTLNDVSYEASVGWHSSGSPRPVEVAPVNGVTVTGYMLYFSATDPIEFEGSSFTVALEGFRVLADDISTQLGSAGITKIEVYGHAVDPSPTVTHNTDGSWGFTMPGYNAALNVTYYGQPALAWTLGGSAIPNDTTITAYYGFHQETMQKISFSMGNDFLTYITGLSSAEQTALFSLLVDSSSNPAVVAIGLQGPEVVGPGECDIYSIFRGNDDFLADTAAFHLTILDPDTLTLAANGNGTVSPLLGGSSATQFHTPANWFGQDLEYPTTEDLPGFLATTQAEAEALATGVSDNMAIVIYDRHSDGRWYYISRDNDSYSPHLTNLAKHAFYSFEEGGFAIYYTTAAVSDSIVASTTEGQYLVIPGATVQAVAEAQDGNHVSAWSDNRQPQHYTSDTNTITVSGSMTLTATFAQNPLLTLATDGQGSVELDGVTYDTEEQSESFTTNQSLYTYTGQNFTITCTHVGDGDGIQIAYNQPITITSTNGQNITRVEFHMTYGHDVISTISSTPGTVVGDGSGTEGNCSITDINATSVSFSSSHSGYVQINQITVYSASIVPVPPYGVTAGTTANTYRVLPGTQLSVTATPGEGSYLAQWSDQTEPVEGDARLGSSHPYTMPATAATLTATFNEIPVLTLASNNSEWGTVEMEGAGSGSSNGYTIKFSANGNTIVKENVTLPKTYQCEYGSPSEFDNIIRELYGWTGVHGNENAIPTVTGTDAITPGTESSRNYPKFTINSAFQGTATVTIGYTNSSWVSDNWPIEISFVPALPAGVLATTEEGVYNILPGTEVKVIATPDPAHYFVNWDEETALNSNTAVEKTLTMGTAPDTLTANFAAKPVLTLAQNESWGTVSVSGPVVWNNQVWGSWDLINTTFPQTIGDITIDKYNFYCYYFSGKLLLDRSTNFNPFVTFTSAGDNFTRIEMTYTQGSNLEPANEWTCANGVAVWEGNAQSVTITNATDFSITQIKFIRGSGIEQLTNNTYRVDYGAEVTLNAEATELHHVQGWQDGNGTALTGATYSDYFVTTPENLFPAKSALTFTLTADTTARALFGINSYDVTATVAESDDVRGTVAIAYTDIDGASQTTAAGASAEATAQGGSTSTLTATPQTGYHFVGWMDNLNTQSALNTQNPLTVTEAGSYTATFDTNSYQIGGSVAEGSTEWGSVEGSGEYRHFTTATLTAMPIEHYHFVRWEDGNTQNPRIIDVTGEESHEAEFAIDRFIVAWSSNDETMGLVVGPYDNHTTGDPIPRLQGSYGTQFNLTASPTEHHMLDHWSTGQTSNVITVTITENAEIVAYFKHVPYNVTVASADETMGSVSGSQESVEWQASTEISATANYGYHFVQWSDGNTANPRTVTINEEHDYSFTATFAKNQYTVTVVTGDATRGSVSGTTTVDYLTDVEISATANEHYHFEQWEDGNMQNPRTVTVTANATYRAYFAPDKYTVTGLADQGQGSVTGSGSYAYLSNATLTAEPACGYLFDHWSNESTESTITFQVTGEMSYTAFFRPAVVDTVTVTVHDTTVVTNTVTVHDTTYVDIHDSIDVTVYVHDTTIVEVPVYVHDTTTVTVTEYVHDTTTVTETEYVHDTTVVNVPVHDTVYVSDGTIIYVHDTTTVEVPVNVYVHDTTTIEVQVPVYVHDTTTIEVQVPVYVYDTTTVYDTTVVEVPVHDTTTVYDTTVVEVPVHDTTTVTEYIHDTVEVTVIVHDTIFIHDTIFVGIEGVDALDAKIYGNNGQIVVEGADFNEVILFDVNGRILARRQDEGMPLRFDIPASGAYLVKIGNHAARRIVMIR